MTFSSISDDLKTVLAEELDFLVKSMVLKLVPCSDPFKSQDQTELCLVCPEHSFGERSQRFLQGHRYPHQDNWTVTVLSERDTLNSAAKMRRKPITTV